MQISEMGRPRRPQRDLSGAGGNPTSELQKNYDALMSIDDPEELADAALGIVQPLVGRGFSEKNYQTFVRNLEQSKRRGVQGIQFFLSNYILKGSGLGVSESKEVAIASLLTENADFPVELNRYQQALKEMVERYGYHVSVIS